MNKEQTKILQSAIFLLDGNTDLILKNGLMPYFKKAKQIKSILEIDTTLKWQRVFK